MRCSYVRVRRNDPHELVIGHHAILADVDPMLEAELVRHFPLGTLAQPHPARDERFTDQEKPFSVNTTDGA